MGQERIVVMVVMVSPDLPWRQLASFALRPWAGAALGRRPHRLVRLGPSPLGRSAGIEAAATPMVEV